MSGDEAGWVRGPPPHPPTPARRAVEVESAARVVLALSLLGHRPFCADCNVHADLIRLALQGATVDELRQLDNQAPP